MREWRNLEIARSILTNAINMNFNQEVILKISEKTDKCIIEYYRKTSCLNNREDNPLKKVTEHEIPD